MPTILFRILLLKGTVQFHIFFYDTFFITEKKGKRRQILLHTRSYDKVIYNLMLLAVNKCLLCKH